MKHFFKSCNFIHQLYTFNGTAPYGIREATERVGSKTKNEFPITEDLLSSHYPSKMEYGMRDMYRDLLNFAAERLKLNGRISFWVPIIRYNLYFLYENTEYSS